MKKLFAKSILIALLCIVTIVIILIIKVDDHSLLSLKLPAPNLSNSYSFNDKMKFAKRKQAQVLAIGSSITLNNLYSPYITKHFQTDSFLNLASWGLNLEDDFKLLKTELLFFKPQYLIVVSNINDFAINSKVVDYNNLIEYFSTNSKITALEKSNYNLSYLIENINLAKTYKTWAGNNEYLGYDKYGAVMLDSTNFKIKHERWMDNSIANSTVSNYQFLDSIISTCKHNNIQLFFFQSPFRSGLTEAHKIDTVKLQAHIKIVKTKILDAKFHFVNSTTKTWDDKLFVDSKHLNKCGAMAFTEYCLTQLK